MRKLIGSSKPKTVMVVAHSPPPTNVLGTLIRRYGIEPRTLTHLPFVRAAISRSWGLPGLAGFLVRYRQPGGTPLTWAHPDTGEAIPFARGVHVLRDQRVIWSQPTRSSGHLYWPRVPGIDWHKVLADTDISIAIVDGELRALALCFKGQPCVGLPGIFAAQRLVSELVQLSAGRALLMVRDAEREHPQTRLGWERFVDALHRHGVRPVIVCARTFHNGVE